MIAINEQFFLFSVCQLRQFICFFNSDEATSDLLNNVTSACVRINLVGSKDPFWTKTSLKCYLGDRSQHAALRTDTSCMFSSHVKLTRSYIKMVLDKVRRVLAKKMDPKRQNNRLIYTCESKTARRYIFEWKMPNVNTFTYDFQHELTQLHFFRIS